MADGDVTNFSCIKIPGLWGHTLSATWSRQFQHRHRGGDLSSFSDTIGAVSSQSYIIVFDMATPAVGGETIATTIAGLNITATGNITGGSIVPNGSITGPTHQVSGTLALANPTAQPANSLVGDGGIAATDNELAAFKLTAAGEQMDVSQVVVNLTYGGTMTAAKVSGFDLYKDVNTNGVFNSGTDTLVKANGTISGAGSNILTFSGLTMPVAAGSRNI